MTPPIMHLKAITSFRPRMYIAVGAFGILLAVVSLLNSQFFSNANAMPEPAQIEPVQEVPLAPVKIPDALLEKAQVPIAPKLNVQRVQVSPGDNISTLLGDLGITPGELHELLSQGERARELRRIFPGQWVEVSRQADGSLEKLKLEKNAANSLEWVRESEGFQLHALEIAPEVQMAYVSETIFNNLFVAGQRSGLGDEIILRLARIFRWDIDFVLDLRTGDSFELVYESEYLNGEFLRYGDIMAARFINRGRDHTAIRYLDEDGNKSYFTPKGESMRGAFLRAPVDFTRVSSGFNHKRLHPLFNRVRAHLGVDYAAPSGTPVKASGKGAVKTLDRNSSSGNYVVIQHPDGIQTRYLHLSRFARGLRPGTRVEQGDVIGFVGATGWATGPHLHYEYIENGRHMDPRRVEVQREEAISERERSHFLAQTTPLLSRLDSFSSSATLVGAK